MGRIENWPLKTYPDSGLPELTFGQNALTNDHAGVCISTERFIKAQEDSSFVGLDQSPHRKQVPKRNRDPNLRSLSEAHR